MHLMRRSSFGMCRSSTSIYVCALGLEVGEDAKYVERRMPPQLSPVKLPI
jgi:hypothetical protein